MPANHCKPHAPAARAKMSASHRGKPRAWRHRPSRIVEGIQEWRCGNCHEYLARDGFYQNRRTLLGITSECRRCHSATSRRTRNQEASRKRQVVYEATRRARKARAGGEVTALDWGCLCEVLGTACLRCGTAENIQRDHVVPLAKGGMHHPLNLQPLCRRCNETKQARAWDFRTEAQKAALREVWVVEFKRVEAGQ